MALAFGFTTWSSDYGQARGSVGIAQTAHKGKEVISEIHFPLSFEPNEGQVNPRAKYLARGRGYTLFLTRGGAVLRLDKERAGRAAGTSDVVCLKLLGANRDAGITASGQLPGHTSYFIGNNPHNWHTDIPNYGRVSYHRIYPGIDAAYYGRQGRIENDFIVSAGSDPGLIRLGIKGAKNLHLNRAGDLVLAVNGGDVYLRRPRAYQGQGKARKNVAVHFALRSGNQVGFTLGHYDHSRKLVIDPVLTYSTFLGGSGNDSGYAIALDSAGDAFVTGSTASSAFPTTGGQASLAGGSDVFVTKLNPAGTALLYSVYLGGGNLDRATGIAVDSSGDVYLTGYTSSTDFPVTPGSYQQTNSGSTDAFVAKLDPSGLNLTYSTYLGGGGTDYGRGIAVDASGDAFITGSTQSTDFPTMDPLQIGLDGGSDAFLSELDPTGANLLYSTYLGGSGADEALAIALDGSGHPYIAGYTFSSNFPTQAAFQSALSGASDAFVAEIDPSTSSLIFSTYLGGTGTDSANSIAVDSVGSIYLAGSTSSTDFPGTSGTSASQGDAFVAKLTPGGTGLVYSTYLGGSGLDQANGIALDSSGDAFVTGFTQSSDFPLMDALQRVLGITGAGSCGSSNCADAFVTKLDPSGAMVYSTFLGGSATDLGQAIAVDSSGAAYLTGSTASSNFPVIAGAPQSTYAATNSSTNAFVAKVSPQDAPAVALSPQTLNFGNEALNTPSTQQTVTLVDAGSSPLTINTIVASGQFSQTNNCGSLVSAGGGTCTIQVIFTPTQTGPVTDQIAITDNAQTSPQTITVTGTGVTAGGGLTLTPTSLSFAPVTVGQTSSAQTVQLVNTGNTAVNISAIDVTGDYSETNTCGSLPTVLNVGGACSVSVAFSPTQTGSRTGTLTVQDDATNTPSSVSLSGTGNPVFSISANARSSVLLIGTQTTTFTISAAAPSSFQGTINLACTTGTCTFNPSSITAGETSTLTVSGLSSSTANPFDFQVRGTSADQTADASLSIFFQDFSLSQTPPSPPLQTVTAGSVTAPYTVTVTPSNGFSGVVLLGCQNLPQGTNATAQNPDTTCTFSPPGLVLNGTPATSTLTISTTASTNSLAPPLPPAGSPPWGHVSWEWWALLALFCLAVGVAFVFAGRRIRALRPMKVRLSFAAFMLAITLTALATACNSNYVGPSTTPVANGTPAGTYTVTIVGTLGSNGSIKRTTTVNLAVSP